MKKPAQKKNKLVQAFTLIELLVYISISTIVLTIILLFTISVVESTTRVGAGQEIYHNSRFSFTKVRYDIQIANGFNVGSSVLDNDNGVIVLNVGANTIRYDIDNGVLTRQFNATPPVPITTSHVQVTKFRIENRSKVGGRTSLNITIEIDIRNPNNRPELDLPAQLIKTNIILRNS